jgi:hypothetical protein
MKILRKIFSSRKLKALLQKHSENKTIIIVFANYQYKEVIDNWLFALKRIEIYNYVIISFDKKLFHYLRQKNIPTFYYKTGTDLNELWINRIRILKDIINNDYNVIHSDADAIWLKNPLKEFFYSQDSDVVFSQGTIWPPDIHKEWDFVLCCGFFGIKSNKATKKLIRDVYHDVVKSGDDQVSFNRIIHSHGTKWKIDDHYKLSFKDKSFLCSKKIIYGSNPCYKIAVLPHHLFQRVNEETKSAYVKHLISEKDSEDIIALLKNNGLFFI